MAWLRVDDGAMTHPRVMRLRAMRDDVATPVAVIGFVMLCATWSGKHNTDCEIPLSVGEMVDPARWELLAKAAVKVGILTRPKLLSTGDKGWLVRIDDGLFHLMSREAQEKNRHRRITRQDQGRVDVHLRDGDECRYCGQTVNPSDGLGGRGREFDHPDPAIPDVVVVSCRRCNLAKAGRTATEAEMELRPPPDPNARYFDPKTLAWLANRGIDPARTAPAETAADPARGPRASAAPRRAPEAAAAAPDDAADLSILDELEANAMEALRPLLPPAAPPEVPPQVPPEGVADLRRPGRVGDGSGGGGSRAGPPRRRGARGKRRRTPEPRPPPVRPGAAHVTTPRVERQTDPVPTVRPTTPGQAWPGQGDRPGATRGGVGSCGRAVRVLRPTAGPGVAGPPSEAPLSWRPGLGQQPGSAAPVVPPAGPRSRRMGRGGRADRLCLRRPGLHAARVARRDVGRAPS